MQMIRTGCWIAGSIVLFVLGWFIGEWLIP